MKRYNVKVEEFNRIDDSVSGGALVDEWFDTEEAAQKQYYTVLSLEEVNL